MNYIYNYVQKNLLELAFFISSTATIGSIFLSNVFDLVPCELCWYQRILMFPLPVIFGVALLVKNKHVYLYALPLIVVGFIIAFYQVLLQEGIITEDVISCSLTSVSCATPQIDWFGFITIPFMSMATFLALGGLMVLQRKTITQPAQIDTEGKTNLQYMVLALITLSIMVYAVHQIVT